MRDERRSSSAIQNSRYGMFCGGMPEEYWSAKNSMGYNWMVNTRIPNVEHLIDQNTDVVILMGVNDLGTCIDIDHINMKAAE